MKLLSHLTWYRHWTRKKRTVSSSQSTFNPQPNQSIFCSWVSFVNTWNAYVCFILIFFGKQQKGLAEDTSRCFNELINPSILRKDNLVALKNAISSLTYSKSANHILQSQPEEAATFSLASKVSHKIYSIILILYWYCL